MQKEEKKLLARRDKSIVKLGDILITAGISANGGWASVASYEILKEIINNAKQWMQDVQEKRSADFHKRLLHEYIDDDKGVEDILQRDIYLEDYYTLLKAALQDDEDKKTIHYAEFFRKIALSEVPEEYKLFFMKMIRELTSYEIELIRKIFVYENYDLIPKRGPTEHVSSLFYTDKLLNKMAVENLLRFGLLERDSTTKVTKVCSQAARSFFRENELTPASIERKTWRPEKLWLITSEESSRFSIRLQELLRKCRIQPGPNLIFGPQLLKTLYPNHLFPSRSPSAPSALVSIPDILTVVVDPKIPACFSSREDVNALIGKIEFSPRVRIIKVLLRNSHDSDVYDYLAVIKEDATIHHVIGEKLDSATISQVIEKVASH